MGEAAARYPEVLPALINALHDQDYDVRGRAAAALGRMGEEAARYPEALPALINALHDQDHIVVREGAVQALGQFSRQGLRVFLRSGRWRRGWDVHTVSELSQGQQSKPWFEAENVAEMRVFLRSSSLGSRLGLLGLLLVLIFLIIATLTVWKWEADRAPSPNRRANTENSHP
jgi:hypothetical protein